MSKITSIGGQALMEGIMMVGPQKTVAAFCDESGEITTEKIKINSIREKYPILKKPFLRGVFSFVDTMRLGMKAMEKSADKLVDESEAETKFEKWITAKLGDKFLNVLMAVAGVLGVVLSIFLFMYLPSLFFNIITGVFNLEIEGFRSLFEGVMKFGIFIAYISLISLMPDIKRVFQFHGAEHKTIFCYENELELNVENVRKQIRFHPRCGTSFLIILIILGVIVGMFIPFSNLLLRTFCKILTLPIIMSLGYELIKLCGKYNNPVTRIVATPGLLVQRITTKEPDDKMIETAIIAMKEVIPENGEDLIKI